MDSPEHTTSWHWRLLVTITFFFFYMLLFPAVNCGCHFSEIGLIFLAPPVLWGIFALLYTHDLPEKIVGHFSFIVALFCIYCEFMSNIIFAFR